MRKGRVWLAAGLAAWSAGGAAAQAMVDDAAMEEQRCVWSCMANTPDWSDNPAYNACIAQQCDAAPAPATGPAPGSADGLLGSWSVGRANDGRPYAAVTIPSEDGDTGIFVQCGGGRGSLALGGFDGGIFDMGLEIDGVRFAVPAGPNGYPEVAITRSSSLLAALRQGASAGVVTADGRINLTFTLRGSSAALARLGGDC